MIADTIRFVLTNVPLILVALTLVFALLRRPSGARAEHWLGWVLFFAVGADALWAGLYHVFAPHTAARFIGWQVSPFQFEIGVADIAMGLTAMRRCGVPCRSGRRSRSMPSFFMSASPMATFMRC
jgi:hypothetical protein